MMNAILLAAGYGSRLRPITNSTPKCLVKIKNQPLLNIWLNKLSLVGVEKILINTHYLSDQVEKFVKKSSYIKKLKLVNEKVLLGTAGTLNSNINFFNNKDGFLIHADNYCVENLDSLVKAHENRPSECLMTMMTFESSNPSSCGIVNLDEKGIVTDFHEKTSKSVGNIANGAVYILSPKSIEIIKNKFNNTKDFSRDIIKNFLGKIYTYKTKQFFSDIGTLTEYEKAQKI